MCFGEHVFDGDRFVFPVVVKCVIHQLHAELRTGLHRTVDPERFVFTNQVRNTGRDDQHFVSGNTSATDSRQQGLCDDADQGAGELGTNLVLQVAREGVDDSVDGPLCTIGVQRAETRRDPFPPR